MNTINTNYNMPIPPENVRGQSIAGPDMNHTAKPVQNENNNTQETTDTKQSGKGANIDYYA